MKARIEKGRIRIALDDDVAHLRAEALASGLDERDAENTAQTGLQALQERICLAIGSAKIVESTERTGAAPSDEMSCALSVMNFRKLKAMGCGLAADTRTREIVERMRLDLVAYDEQSRRGDAVKSGKVAVTAFNYAFKHTPFKHQVNGFLFLHAFPEPALFGDCGTGKTFIVSCFADSMVKMGKSLVLLVVCPVNLISHVWLEDVAKFTDLTAVGLREEKPRGFLAEDFDEKGDPPATDRAGIQARSALRASRRTDPLSLKRARLRATKRHNQLLDARFEQDANVYIINPENLRNDVKEKRVIALCKRLLKEGKQIMLVIDESSKLKSRTSRTYMSLKKIRAHCERCVIMTGTPSPNGIQDLWSQFSVLDGGRTLQPNFVDYRHDTCREVVLKGVTWQDKSGATHNATKWNPKPGMAMQVYRTIEPRTIRFRTEDCIDLPPRRFIIRDVEMAPEQLAVYEGMEDMLFVEFEGAPVTARVAAAKMIKLREVTGGFVIDDNKVERAIGKDTPKMVELDLLLEQCIADKLGDTGPPSKAIIWAQYQWECKTLVQRYRKYGARGLFGGISSSSKDDTIRRFKSDPDCRLIVCHPASVGHGLTLTSANHVFYYSLSHNFEEFYQSYRRNSRPGQLRAMTYWFLVCPGTIDEELIDAIRAKKNLSDIVTDGRLSREDILGQREERRGAHDRQISLDWDMPEAPLPTD